MGDEQKVIGWCHGPRHQSDIVSLTVDELGDKVTVQAQGPCGGSYDVLACAPAVFNPLMAEYLRSQGYRVDAPRPRQLSLA